MRTLSVAALILILFGCASSQVLQQENQAKYFAEFQAKLKALTNAWESEIKSSPDFQLLAAKVPFRAEDATFSQLSDESKLNPVEKESWERLQMINDKYERQRLMLFAEYRSWEIQVIQKSDSLVKAVRYDLYQGKIAVSQYLKRRRELSLAINKEYVKADEQHDEDMKFHPDQQAMIDKANGLSILNMQQSMPKPNGASMPTGH